METGENKINLSGKDIKYLQLFNPANSGARDRFVNCSKYSVKKWEKVNHAICSIIGHKFYSNFMAFIKYDEQIYIMCQRCRSVWQWNLTDNFFNI